MYDEYREFLGKLGLDEETEDDLTDVEDDDEEGEEFVFPMEDMEEIEVGFIEETPEPSEWGDSDIDDLPDMESFTN
jgi:hypothetical protein